MQARSKRTAMIIGPVVMLIMLSIASFSPAKEEASRKPDTVTAIALRNFPPLYITGEYGKPGGFAIDVMNEIAHIAGIRIQYLQVNTWEEAFDAVKSGRADLIPNHGITEDRREWFAFTAPVETFPVSIIVRKATGDINDEDDLAGHRVAVVKVNVGVLLMKERADIEMVVFEDIQTALLELLAGNVDALIYPKPVLMKMAADAGLEDRIKTAGAPLMEVKRAISVRKDNTALLNKLNEAVLKFTGSDGYRRIYIKWYGKPAPFWTVTRVVFTMSGLFLLVITIMAAWRYAALRKINLQLRESVDSLKESRQIISEKETRLRTIMENVPGTVYRSEISTPWRSEHISEAVSTLTGRSRNEFLDGTVHYGELIHPDDLEGVKSTIDEGVKNHTPFETEYRIRHADGSIRWVHEKGRAVYDETDSPLWLDGVIIDITDRKTTEEAVMNIAKGVSAEVGDTFFARLTSYLVETLKADYAYIAEVLPDTPHRARTLALFADGQITDNIEVDLSGTPCEHVIRDKACYFAGDVPQQFPEAHIMTQLQVKSYIGMPLISASGKRLGILSVMYRSAVKDVEFIESLLRIFASRAAAEIERKMSEESIARSRAEFEAILNSIPDAVIFADIDRRIIMANPSMQRIFGYSADELRGKKTEVIYAEKSSFEKQGQKRFHVGAAPALEPYEMTYRRKDGSSFPGETLGTTVKDREGNTIGFIGIIRDISERRKAEGRYRLLFENSPLGIFHFLTGGEITDCNGKFVEIIGASKEKLLQFNLLKDLEDPKMQEAVRIALAGGYGHYEGDYTSVAGGKVTPVKADFAPLIAKDGSIIGGIGVFEDISERKKLEEQLRHAQKMEAVGQLAGGVAHEFNNILTAIINNVYLVQRKTGEDDPVQENLARIVKLSDNAARIAGELLAFSRKQHVDLSPLKLNDVVKGAEKLLKNFIREDIEFRVLLTDREPTVMADRHQIEQVIINLATNARDAMPGGGSLTIETGAMEMDDKFIKTHGFGSPGSYALLSVTDTGEGISEDIRQKIFEPFFTTKEVGRGTGLGLSIVYGIIRQHNGHVDVFSDPVKGTTFRVFLPEIRASVRKYKTAVPADLTGKGELILLAEDEVYVRDSIKSVLEGSGYRVIEAVDGKDAVEKFSEHKDTVDLLILDVIMPVMNGREAYEAIKKIKPAIKAVFISGYTSDIIRTGKIIEEDLPFVSKPLYPDNLLSNIREVLEG